MKHYDVAIITAAKTEPYNPAKDLHAALNALAEQGYDITHVMPNGVDRWTVVAARDVRSQLPVNALFEEHTGAAPV